MSSGSLVINHHVHHVMIMSSSCQLQACEFTGEDTLGRETRFFPGKVASGVASVGSLFPRVQGSI
jgi:hypothetical protein